MRGATKERILKYQVLRPNRETRWYGNAQCIYVVRAVSYAYSGATGQIEGQNEERTVLTCFALGGECAERVLILLWPCIECNRTGSALRAYAGCVVRGNLAPDGPIGGK